MSATKKSARKSSLLNPIRTPESTVLPLRAISANTAARRAPMKTPGKADGGRTPTGPASTVRRRARYTPGKVVKPTTPHGIRALEQRRAGALTPGRGRRRSGKIQRETPRDLLRQLSRVLPRQVPSPAKENLPPTEEEEESEDDLSLESPRLSFGVYNDNRTAHSGRQSIEKGRRAHDATRLSMDATMLDLGLDGSDPEDEDAPTTKLLDEDISDSDMSIPEPTFGERDNMGDTIALRQLMALTRSPHTPEQDSDPPTPTADMSFALDIPNFVAPEVQIADDDDEFAGGFELPQLEEDELTSDPRDLTLETACAKAPLELGAIKHHILDAMNAKAKSTTKTIKLRKTRAPNRDGLPKGVVKRVAMSFLRSPGGKNGRLKKGALDAILTASDWFFEQASEDVSAYAEHAGRKVIDESDVLMLARRQRLLNKKSTLFSLAQKFLPGELLKDIKGVQSADKAY